jgi:hypothetical protein
MKHRGRGEGPIDHKLRRRRTEPDEKYDETDNRCRSKPGWTNPVAAMTKASTPFEREEMAR